MMDMTFKTCKFKIIFNVKHVLSVVGFLTGLAWFFSPCKHTALCNNILFLLSTLSVFLAVLYMHVGSQIS